MTRHKWVFISWVDKPNIDLFYKFRCSRCGLDNLSRERGPDGGPKYQTINDCDEVILKAVLES